MMIMLFASYKCLLGAIGSYGRIKRVNKSGKEFIFLFLFITVNFNDLK